LKYNAQEVVSGVFCIAQNNFLDGQQANREIEFQHTLCCRYVCSVYMFMCARRAFYHLISVGRYVEGHRKRLGRVFKAMRIEDPKTSQRWPNWLVCGFSPLSGI